MLSCRSIDGGFSETTALRRWVSREAEKDEYPAVDPSVWDRDRLVRELESTFDEPVPAATRDSPTWLSITLDAEEVGKLDPFPGPGWSALSKDGTVSDAVERLRSRDLTEEFPRATAKIDEFRTEPPAGGFGALLARQDGEWPPVLLDGNHRACAVHWLSREGDSNVVTVHLAVEDSPETLPLTTTESSRR